MGRKVYKDRSSDIVTWVPKWHEEADCSRHKWLSYWGNRFTSHSTQNWSLRRCPSHPISWLSTEETKPNTTKANGQGQNGKKTQKANLNLNKHLTVRTAHMYAYHCAPLDYTIQHRTVQTIFSLTLQMIIIAQTLATRGSPGVSGSNQNDQLRSTNSQIYIHRF